MQSIIFEKKEKIGSITLNRPKQRNALSLNLMQELQEKLNTISKDREIHVVIIKGNGPVFSAGHDLKQLTKDTEDVDYFRNIFSVCRTLMKTLHLIPQVVIAQVHGIAAAAGCQLVASCDLAVCDSKTRFSTPGVKIGLFCSTPMVPLSRMIPMKNALDMLFTGRAISAMQAERFGLVNKVVKAERLADETIKLAEEISKYSLHTIETGKKAFYHQINMSEDDAYDYCVDVISKNCMSYDAQEGMSAFLQKRAAEWKDR